MMLTLGNLRKLAQKTHNREADEIGLLLGMLTRVKKEDDDVDWFYLQNLFSDSRPPVLYFLSGSRFYKVYTTRKVDEEEICSHIISIDVDDIYSVQYSYYHETKIKVTLMFRSSRWEDIVLESEKDINDAYRQKYIDLINEFSHCLL